jgi:hypothetical protein
MKPVYLRENMLSTSQLDRLYMHTIYGTLVRQLLPWTKQTWNIAPMMKSIISPCQIFGRESLSKSHWLMTLEE